MHALHQEATGATRQALSCVPQSVLASLPLWTPQGSYSEGAKVRDGGQAWTCLQSQCPTEWEPGSPGTAALWQAAPVCGIQPWSPASVSYDPGTIVSYNGSLYQGIQPNLSQPGYDPVSAPAVWQPFDPAQNAPGAQGDAAQLTPILDCVALTGFGEYTAVFGYSNASSGTIVAPIGSTNEFTQPAPPVAPAGRGQPIAFQPGQHDGAFVVDFDGNALTWQLGDQSVTASSSSTQCTTTQGTDGAVATYGGSPILMHPNPSFILPNSVLPTETAANGLAVGGLRGNFSVTGDGAATYQFPLWTPPGRMGMQPRLSLSYSSRTPRGLAGLGWDLTGFGISRIARCQKTIAQDGDATPIAFTNEDAFCLDGARLVPTSEKTAQTVVYAPEHDPFTRVVFKDTGALQVFTVYRRDGAVMTYGTAVAPLSATRTVYAPSPDGSGGVFQETPQVNYEWALDSVTDATGNNVMSISWKSLTTQFPMGPCHEMFPAQILYGPQGSRQVSFAYENDPNPTCQFVSGFGVASTQRLQEIDMSGPTGVGAGLFRSYKLTYHAAHITGRTLLDSVQECERSGVCSPPTKLDYSEGLGHFDAVPNAFSPVVTWLRQNNIALGVDLKLAVFSDVNNDGKDDLVYPPYRLLALSNGQQLVNPHALVADSSVFAGQDLIRFDGRGRLIHSLTPAFADLTATTVTAVPFGFGAAPVVAGDLDGDGRVDIVVGNLRSQSTVWQYALASNGYGSQATIVDPNGATLDSADPTAKIAAYVAKLDGTAKTALLFHANLSGGQVGSTGSPMNPQYLVSVVAAAGTGATSVSGTTLPQSPAVTDPNAFYRLFIDLNGDGSSDALQIPIQGGTPKVVYNTGAGFGQPQTLPGASNVALGNLNLPPPPSFFSIVRMFVVDWNGDGLPDILLSGGFDSNGASLPARVWSSNGSGGVTGPLYLTDSSGTVVPGATQVLDFDGDGQLDVVTVANRQLAVYRHTDGKSDQLTGIHDGFGKDILVTYKSIGDPSVYTPDTGCQFPQNCTNRGVWVVSEYSVTADYVATNPAAVNKYSYVYAGGRSDMRGRGWLGASTQAVTNEQTLTTVTTTFDNGSGSDENDIGFGYPKAGLPLQVIATTTIPFSTPSGGGVTTRTTTTINQYDVVPTFNNRAASVRSHQTETRVEETTAGASVKFSTSILSDVTTSFGYDAFNNVTSRTTTYLDGEVRTHSAFYEQNTSNSKYLLSLLLTSSERSDVPGQGSIMRTPSYDPDTNTGLLKDEKTQLDGGPTQKLFTQYDRNASGQVLHTISTAADPLNIASALTRESWTTYDPGDDTFPVSTINALGHTTRTLYHPSLGVPVFTQDRNGVVAHIQYDGFGRPRTLAALGQPTTTQSYQGAPPKAPTPGFYVVKTSNDMGGSVTVTYDALDNEVSRITKNHDGSFSYVDTFYTQVLPGQVLKVSRPFPLNVPVPVTVFTSYQYDPLGRPVLTTLPDGSTVETQYNGLATTIVDPRGYARTLIYDDKGRVAQVDEDSTPNETSDPTQSSPGSNASVVSTAYAYGPFDVLNTVSVRPRGGSAFTTVSTMIYDALGRRTNLIDTDMGGSVTTYDAFGEPVTDLDANGQTHIFTRDSIGRTTVDYSTQDGSATLVWDTAPHGVGRLATSKSSDSVSCSYAYDSFSQEVEAKWSIAGNDYAIDKVLDAFGRVQTLQFPAVGSQQLSVTYGFDAIGQVASVTGSDSLAPLTWAGKSWEADGLLTLETFNDGEQTTRSYDGLRAWLTDIVTTSPSGGVQNLHYDHDVSGNVSGRKDQILGTSETFDHDFLNRLDKWVFRAPSGNSWNTGYDLDDLGNLRARSMSGPGAPPVAFNYGYGTRDGEGHDATAPGLHAVTSLNGAVYGYDLNGNQLTAPGRTVAYTSFGLPKKIVEAGSATSLGYDPNHQRAFKTRPQGASTVYVGGLYEKRTNTAGSVTHVFFVPSGSRIMGQIEWAVDARNNVTQHNVVYFHDDYLGSIESITGPTTATTHLKYGPFGARISQLDPTIPGQAPRNLADGFTDQVHDDELGLVNMQGRVYDPALQRFLSPDPYVPGPLTSQGFNRYSYVVNSPASLVDPTGFYEEMGSSGGGDYGGYGGEPSGQGSDPGGLFPGGEGFPYPSPGAPNPFSGGCNGPCTGGSGGGPEGTGGVTPGTTDPSSASTSDSNGPSQLSAGQSSSIQQPPPSQYFGSLSPSQGGGGSFDPSSQQGTSGGRLPLPGKGGSAIAANPRAVGKIVQLGIQAAKDSFTTKAGRFVWASERLGRAALLDAIRAGEDVVVDSPSMARELAREAGGGREPTLHTMPADRVEQGFLPHYHPNGSGSHVFFDPVGGFGVFDIFDLFGPIFIFPGNFFENMEQFLHPGSGTIAGPSR